MKKNISVFIDFDGTITKKDIGDRLFIEYGEFEPWHTRLVNKEIEIKEYWHELSKRLDKNLTPEMIAEYALKFEVDAYFKQFVGYCQEKNYKVSIVSDGFDVYVLPIVRNLGLTNLPIFINKLNFEANTFVPEFPGASESCDCLCASCKRNSILSNTSSDDIFVFIGDGYSDYCAAEHSDIVFAKRQLAAYCNEKRIPHYPWSNFFDVLRLMKDIEKKKRFKTRHQAFLKRKKAFEVE